MENINISWVIGISAFLIILLIIIYFYIVNAKRKKHKKRLESLQVRYNQIKSIPLPFKLDKAYSISLVDPQLLEQVKTFQKNYNLIDDDFKLLQDLFVVVEDKVSLKRYRDLDKDFIKIEEKIKETETKVNDTSVFLDAILEREILERNKANNLKEKFQKLKQEFNQNYHLLGSGTKNIEDQLSQCENLFSDFEDHIYMSEFVKAQQDLVLVEEKIVAQQALLSETPALLELVECAIPTLRNEIERQYTLTKQRGVYLDHLNVDKRLEDLNKRLGTNRDLVVVGKLEGVKSSLDIIVEELRYLLVAFSKENKALSELKEITSTIEKSFSVIDDYYNKLNQGYKYVKTKTLLEDLEVLKEGKEATFGPFKQRYNKLKEESYDVVVAPSELVIKAKELIKDIDQARKDLNSRLTHLNQLIRDEENAILHLAKFQLLIFEMKAKIAQSNLPSISEKHQADISECYEYIRKIKECLAGSPLDNSKLTNLTKEAIDYIFDVYRKVNNVVQMAIMVEKVITFGNKYRSTYQEIDSELTKSELAFKNGEYFNALTIAINGIEKIFPNSLNGDLINS